jgi:2-polyprenyl-3-methyl-5-hydroxy-6-metoxy-1,4-benzoquinol methylase
VSTWRLAKTNCGQACALPSRTKEFKQPFQGRAACPTSLFWTSRAQAQLPDFQELQGNMAIDKNYKRSEELSSVEVQRGNSLWWTRNPMAYDWEGKIKLPRFSPGWYRAIDAEFLYGSRLFATLNQPFDQIIPIPELRGARVLEIGCGMGLHTQTMAAAGAEVTAIDLTSTAVEATSRRLALWGLPAQVLQCDAENLPFTTGAFDFVWSWGVIHHSSQTARIVREIARVLKKTGACRVMVYNREGMPARICFIRDYFLKGKFLRQSFEETLYQSSDGFSARFYVREQFEDVFRAFFKNVSSEVCGQESDAIPLPAPLRRWVLTIVPEGYLYKAQAKRGAFIFLRASSPY